MIKNSKRAIHPYTVYYVTFLWFHVKERTISHIVWEAGYEKIRVVGLN